MLSNVSGRRILQFIKDNVKPDGSVLVSDEYQAYKAVRSIMPHAVIKHQQKFVDGDTHTNTIEGFWALLKRAWYGSHHHYRKKFTPLYVAEACYKYNHRKKRNIFKKFVRECFV